MAVLEKKLIVKDSVNMNNEAYKWFPVYTNPRAEKKAFDILQAKGIETYLPLQKRLKQWSDRKKWVHEPLISSYLFVRINKHMLQEVLSTQGVCRFIYFSGKMACVSEREIENLRLLLASENELELTERKFNKGEKVLVNAGPLMGLRGELVDHLSQKKLLVRLGDTGKSLLVQIPPVFLELEVKIGMTVD